MKALNNGHFACVISVDLQKAFETLRTHSLVVSDLHLETKGSKLKSACWPCAEVSSVP